MKQLFWLIMLFLIVGCGEADQSWQRIEDAGLLRVGIDPTYPPFANADGGQLEGYEVDLMHALAAELGVGVQFVYLGYDGLYDALGTGQVDLLLSAMVIRPEMRKDYAFSDPYFDVGERLVLSIGSGINAVTDLSGRSVAVEMGSQAHLQGLTLQKKDSTITLQSYNTPDEALLAAANGTADAAIADAVSGWLFLRSHPDSGLQIQEPSLSPEPLVMVVRVADEQLLEQLNDALAALEAGGRMALLNGRWFGKGDPSAP